MENSMKNSIDIDQGHKGIETENCQLYGDQLPETQT